MKQIRRHLSKCLEKLGISTENKGYYYIRDSVLHYLGTEGCDRERFRTVNSVIAGKYNDNVRNILDAERRAITGGWDFRDRELSYELFEQNGFVPKNPPTSRQLIKALSNWTTEIEK